MRCYTSLSSNINYEVQNYFLTVTKLMLNLHNKRQYFKACYILHAYIMSQLQQTVIGFYRNSYAICQMNCLQVAIISPLLLQGLNFKISWSLGTLKLAACVTKACRCRANCAMFCNKVGLFWHSFVLCNCFMFYIALYIKLLMGSNSTETKKYH